MSKGNKVRLNFLSLMLVLVVTFGFVATSQAQVMLFQDFEGSFPPTGWSVTNDDGGPVVWHRSDVAPNYGTGQSLPISGYFAYAESYPAYCGFSYDTSLITPAFSTVGMDKVEVSFAFQYWVYSSEHLALDYRIGAGPWVNIENLPSYGGYTAQSRTVDISMTAGNPSVQLRWRYYNLSSGCDWWTSIDNVVIAEYSCIGQRCYSYCPVGLCPQSYCTVNVPGLSGCLDVGQITYCGCTPPCDPSVCRVFIPVAP
jgi:hypothetical protein